MAQEVNIWFPIYARDFLADGRVRRLTPAQRGHLVDLWCYQWRDGPLPNDLGDLCRMLGEATIEDVQKVVGLFFTASEDGKMLVSQRLTRELTRAEQLREARRKRTAAATKARLGGKKNVTSDVTDNVTLLVTDTPSPSPAPLLHEQKGRAKKPPRVVEAWIEPVRRVFASKIGVYTDAQIRRKVGPVISEMGEMNTLTAARYYVNHPELDNEKYFGLLGFPQKAKICLDRATPMSPEEAAKFARGGR